MNDGLLDPCDEGPNSGVGKRGAGQASGFARGGEIGADQRMQARRRDIGIRLAEPEDAPVWATIGAPAGLVTGQFEQVGPANVLIRPAELDRHLSRHADN